MRTAPPTNRLDHLAAETTRLAEATRNLERAVADAVDVPACLPAREAAYRLEDLAGLLAEEVSR